MSGDEHGAYSYKHCRCQTDVGGISSIREIMKLLDKLDTGTYNPTINIVYNGYD